MATVKLRFRPSSVPAKEGSLAYLVMQGHMTKQIKTGCKLSEEEWNGGDIHAATPDREQYIDWVKSELAEQEKRILYIIKVLEHTFPAYTANDVIKAYTLPERQYDTFITFTRNVIASLHTAGRYVLPKRIKTRSIALCAFETVATSLSETWIQT